MSLSSKITLYGSISVSLGIIVYVCSKQNKDRHDLRQSVIRDLERQRQKAENLYALQQQNDLKDRLQEGVDVTMNNISSKG